MNRGHDIAILGFHIETDTLSTCIADFKMLSTTCIWVWALTLYSQMTSMGVWPFDSLSAISYSFSTGTNILSPTDLEILRIEWSWSRLQRVSGVTLY